MERTIRPFWHPAVAGLALGLVLFLTFIITGHGLGASGFFARAGAWFSELLATDWARANAYFGPFLRAHPLDSWITWEIVGLAAGALVGALGSGRFRLSVERGPRMGSGGRLLLALLGGILTGFGARLARGCTSGLGLSGGGTLAVAGFVFLITFFIGGFLVSLAVRKEWI